MEGFQQRLEECFLTLIKLTQHVSSVTPPSSSGRTLTTSASLAAVAMSAPMIALNITSAPAMSIAMSAPVMPVPSAAVLATHSNLHSAAPTAQPTSSPCKLIIEPLSETIKYVTSFTYRE